jgi:DnaJ-class molecular chaperone
MSEGARDPRAAVAQFVEQAYAALERTSYYQILGLPKDATGAQIRAAYYRLASRLHPDLHADAFDAELRHKLTAVFSRVVEAYKMLSHGERREQYDRQLADGNVRWSADAAKAQTKIKRAEEQVRDGAARKFFVLGRNALLAGNGKAAVMNLRMALSMEPHNDIIKAELARAEALAASQGVT